MGLQKRVILVESAQAIGWCREVIIHSDDLAALSQNGVLVLADRSAGV